MTANNEQVRKTIERHNANAIRWYAADDADSLATLFAAMRPWRLSRSVMRRLRACRAER